MVVPTLAESTRPRKSTKKTPRGPLALAASEPVHALHRHLIRSKDNNDFFSLPVSLFSFLNEFFCDLAYDLPLCKHQTKCFLPQCAKVQLEFMAQEPGKM